MDKTVREYLEEMILTAHLGEGWRWCPGCGEVRIPPDMQCCEECWEEENRDD